MNKTILLLITIAITSSNLMTLDLGSMSVESTNEEKLNAAIKILSSKAIEVSDIELENSKNTFIKNSNFIDIDKIIKEIKEINGEQIIFLTTKEPVTGNQYDFNLRINKGDTKKSLRFFGFIPKGKSKNPMNKFTAVNSLSSCLELIDPVKRLECYDLSLSRQKQEEDKVMVLQENKVKEPNVQVTEDDYFGKRGEALEEVIAETQRIIIPNELSNVITKVTRYAADKYMLTLKNGQKWKVLEPTRKGYFKVDQNVSISKGLFGSYDLNIQSLNKKYKVKRED